MRLFFFLATALAAISGLALAAGPEVMPKEGKDKGAQQLQVTADQSLEWYQDKRLYVARGNAKAVRGTLTVTADTLTAHEREKQPGAPKQKQAGDKNGAGDVDLMTAEGHVVIVDARQRITGEHAVYDLDKHQMVVTGDNLRYETAKDVVTARDSLEYYEDTKLAIARGHAIADQADRHVEGDVLTAEFRDAPNGQSQLTKMTAQGHVTVLTRTKEEPGDKSSGKPNSRPKTKGGDVSQGDNVVYDAGSNMAVLTGNVHVTKKDGTELAGDVGEVNFNNNQSRLMSDGVTNGSGRVRALLPPKTTDKAATPAPVTTPSAPAAAVAP